MEQTKIFIGSDHAGYDLKNEVYHYLKTKNFDVEDCGAFSSQSVDYPDFAHKVASNVVNNNCLGILVCGSANGVAITANKHVGVRAAIAWLPEIAALARQHNNANTLCLPARFISVQAALDIVDHFLNSSFEGGRHELRVNKIEC